MSFLFNAAEPPPTPPAVTRPANIAFCFAVRDLLDFGGSLILPLLGGFFSADRFRPGPAFFVQAASKTSSGFFGLDLSTIFDLGSSGLGFTLFCQASPNRFSTGFCLTVISLLGEGLPLLWILTNSLISFSEALGIFFAFVIAEEGSLFIRPSLISFFAIVGAIILKTVCAPAIATGTKATAAGTIIKYLLILISISYEIIIGTCRTSGSFHIISSCTASLIALKF